ncbi:hypothetical protein MRI28_11810 [Nocardiopsis dassonvillei]|uniref:hypothetical protein n=1 Tax=Nocardiopsis dassonvillei TaxID=2014 RepID=UPI00200ED1F9|nr:hypothetical protein [Nocardiopsis dassonvillei]MCK9870317.1 hypothetical protein [Nocardiopsis dassonvillei]
MHTEKLTMLRALANDRQDPASAWAAATMVTALVHPDADHQGLGLGLAGRAGHADLTVFAEVVCAHLRLARIHGPCVRAVYLGQRVDEGPVAGLDPAVRLAVQCSRTSSPPGITVSVRHEGRFFDEVDNAGRLEHWVNHEGRRLRAQIIAVMEAYTWNRDAHQETSAWRRFYPYVSFYTP